MKMPMSQKARAAAILKHMPGSSPASGRWVERKRGSKTVAIWVIEADAGWSASFDFEADGSANVAEVTDPLENLARSFSLDVWFRAEGVKVLSLEWTAPSQTMRLISMRPGPWEEMFGLPPRDWSPSDLRKLTSRQVVVPMMIGELAAGGNACV